VTGPRRALLVCYGGAHAATLAPVAAALAERGTVEPVSLALTTAATTFKRRGLPFRGYHDFVDPATDRDALQLGEELLPTLGAGGAVDREESVAYLGLSMAALVAEVGETEARARFAKIGRHAFLPRAVLRRIVARVAPSVVVATNSPKSERAALLAGNEAGLPTLMVPDLVVDPSWEAYGPFEAKWFAAMNEVAKGNLVRHHGADPARIVITGQPAFDKSRAPSPDRARAYATQATGWRQARPYLVVATTWDQLDLAGGALGQEARADHAHQVVDLVQRLAAARYDLIVKPHPSEPVGSYTAGDGTFIAPPGAELDPLLVGSEGLIAAGSTTSVVDGLSLGKATVLVQLDGKEPLVPAAGLGVPVARTAADVERWLAGLADGTAPSRAATANTGAAARVAALIERLAAMGVA
jgi:hypothetical protein